MRICFCYAWRRIKKERKKRRIKRKRETQICRLYPTLFLPKNLFCLYLKAFIQDESCRGWSCPKFDTLLHRNASRNMLEGKMRCRKCYSYKCDRQRVRKWACVEESIRTKTKPTTFYKPLFLLVCFLFLSLFIHFKLVFSCLLPHVRWYCLRTGKHMKLSIFRGFFVSLYYTSNICSWHMSKENIAENVLKLAQMCLTRILQIRKRGKNTIILLSNHNNCAETNIQWSYMSRMKMCALFLFFVDHLFSFPMFFTFSYALFSFCVFLSDAHTLLTLSSLASSSFNFVVVAVVVDDVAVCVRLHFVNVFWFVNLCKWCS